MATADSISAQQDDKKLFFKEKVAFLLVNQDFFVLLQSRFSGTCPERLFN